MLLWQLGSRALCSFPSVKRPKIHFTFFRSMYNKTIIRFGFCTDIQNNQGRSNGTLSAKLKIVILTLYRNS